MTGTIRRPDLTEKVPTGGHWPPVLLLGDIAALFGLRSERAARDFIRRYHIPHIELGNRMFVVRNSLLEHLVSIEQTRGRGGELRSIVDRCEPDRPRALRESSPELSRHRKTIARSRTTS